MRERKFQVDSNPTFRVRKAKILGHSEYIKALKEDDPQGILSIIKNSFKDDLGLFVMMIRPLHKACKYNAIKTIHFLLSEVKINPNLSKFSSTKKLTALHIAASNENPAALEALLQYDNVNRNCVNSIGETPLINAAERGLLANVEKLLEDKNVNVSFCNYSGHSALDTALIHQKPSVIAPLLKKIDVTFRCQGKTLLQFGVYLSSPECVAELLKDKRIRESASQDENMALKLAVEQKKSAKDKIIAPLLISV